MTSDALDYELNKRNVFSLEKKKLFDLKRRLKWIKLHLIAKKVWVHYCKRFLRNQAK